MLDGRKETETKEVSTTISPDKGAKGNLMYKQSKRCLGDAEGNMNTHGLGQNNP